MSARPVLVGYDGSPGARAAARWALDEAARSGRAVQLLFAHEGVAPAAPMLPPVVWPVEAAWRDAEAMLHDAVVDAAASHPTVSVSSHVADGNAAARLWEQSRHAALVVVGDRGHGGFTGLLAGSTAVAVSAHARCPVVVVRGERAVRAASARPGHVVAGVDDSACAQLALGFAVDQATQRGVPLHVNRVWHPPAPKYRPLDFDVAEAAAAERIVLDQVVSAWRGKHPGVQLTTEVVAGRAARVLVDATRNAGLVVVGSRGRGGFAGLLLGSVSQQLLHHSHCPVAVVREVPADGGDR